MNGLNSKLRYLLGKANSVFIYIIDMNCYVNFLEMESSNFEESSCLLT
jgi:hypothetical protein